MLPKFHLYSTVFQSIKYQVWDWDNLTGGKVPKYHALDGAGLCNPAAPHFCSHQV